MTVRTRRVRVYTPPRRVYVRTTVAPTRYVRVTTGTRYRRFRTRRISYNSYLRNGRTYVRLRRYYLPPNYYNGAGYYSYRYRLKYYDGYGYNFYTGRYGYYEDYVYVAARGGGALGGIIGGVIVGLCCCICIVWHCKRRKGDDVEEEEVVEEVEEVEEEVKS